MKRMGKQLVGMTAAVLLAAWSFPAAIVNAEGFTGEYERLIDMADLLTYEEESELLETLNEISERQKMDIVLITSEDMDGYSDIQDYADDLYDYCDYGYGANRDGVLLLISMEESDWYISTCGYGITAFTDAGIRYLESAMKEDLSSGNYVAAFHTYASECDQLIMMAREGHPFSNKDLPPCTVITTGTSYLYCDWSGGSISYRGQHEGSAENGAETGNRSKLCKKRKYEAGNPAGLVPVQ